MNMCTKVTKYECSRFAKFRNKVLGFSALACATMAGAAPTDQLDSLSNTLQTVQTKAEGISGNIIGIVTIAVIMAIVIGWLKKGKKAGNG